MYKVVGILLSVKEKSPAGFFNRQGFYSSNGLNSGGYFVSGLILTWAGFDNEIDIQTPETIFWIRAMLAGLPIVGFILVIFFILRMPLTKQKCEEIRITLEERRGKV